MPDDPTPEPEPKDPPDPTPDADDKPDPQVEIDKWKSHSRKHESQAKANAAAAKELQELKDKDKSESEKLADELAAAKAEGSQSTTQLLRLEVALEKAPDGLSAADVRKYAKRLQGSSREELEADAEEFFEDFGSSDTDGPPARKPTTRLRGGGDPEDEPEPDLKKVVADIPRL